MEIFINGIGNISPQNTLDNGSFLEEPVNTREGLLRCINPEYKKYISPVKLRRMSRVLRFGVTSALMCLKDAGIEKPDAVITGTGLGCLEDTEKFLRAMIANDETLLTPTSFIQSTHNTIGAQIALLLKCHNHNLTFVHRNFSFESALLDAIMLLRENSTKNILTGGVDEITDEYIQITGRTGNWKKNKIFNLELFQDNSKGSIPGEGAAFFVLSGKRNDNSYARLNALKTIYKPASLNETTSRIRKFLENNKVGNHGIDVLITGKNGDPDSDKIYDRITDSLFNKSQVVAYKHLCGEYFTSSAFGLWLGCQILKKQFIPNIIKMNEVAERPINNILFYNHYRNSNHSLIYLSKC